MVIALLVIGGTAFALNKKYPPSTTSGNQLRIGRQNQPTSETNTDVTNQDTNNSVTTISMSEAQQHNSITDCYLIIKNSVYDVTSFIDQHPGGKNKIIENCGSEVTGVFTKIHSNFAWDLLGKYKVADLSQ